MPLLVKYATDPYTEMSITGTQVELEELSYALSIGKGNLACSPPPRATLYTGCISRIHIRCTSGGVKVNFQIRGSDTLEMNGDLDGLQGLAETISNFAHSESTGDHIHLEYTDDYCLYDPNSFPASLHLR